MRNSEQPVRIIDNTHLYPVLTKLEYTAIMTMNGILSNEKLRMNLILNKKSGTTNENCVAAYAVRVARELLKQLENQ